MVRTRTLLLVGLALASLPFVPPAVRAQQTPQPVFLLSPAEREAIELAAVQGLAYIPGEVIVKFREGTTVATQGRVLSVLRERPLPERLRWIADRTAVLRMQTDNDAPSVAATLRTQPEVEYAQPNWLLRPKQAAPNDTQYAARQWNLAQLDMPRAWAINTGANITVAVIDSGMTSVNQTYAFRTWNGTANVIDQMEFAINPDLAPERIVTGRDFVFWSGPVLDSDGHGTHVSATVAQTTNNTFGYAGMAYGAKVMPLKACLSYWDVQILRSEQGVPGYAPADSGGCPTSAVVAAIRHAADNGAKVINISLGGFDQSQSFLDALNYAVGKGVFVAMAAGNEFEDGNPTNYPAAYGPQVAGAMTVGAVGRSSRKAYYSSTGTYVEIAAPGGDLRDGGSTGVVWQWGIQVSDFNPDIIVFPRFDRYTDTGLQGTSMASPHVAALGALLMSQGVTSPAAVEALITRTASDLGTAGKDNEFGAGLIRPREALRGFGIVR